MPAIELNLEGNPVYRCESCGRLAESLCEADDYVWVCGDCFRIYNSDQIGEVIKLSDPDCMI